MARRRDRFTSRVVRMSRLRTSQWPLPAHNLLSCSSIELPFETALSGTAAPEAQRLEFSCGKPRTVRYSTTISSTQERGINLGRTTPGMTDILLEGTTTGITWVL